MIGTLEVPCSDGDTSSYPDESDLGVTKDTIYSWIGEKGMPAHKLGRLWKFQAAEVDDWVRRNGATATED